MAISNAQSVKHLRRESYNIVVSPGLWRGFDVTIEPPTVSHPLRGFRTHDDALAHAEAISAVEGWPITHRTERST